MFDTLRTGIDGLDSLLGGGIRYPSQTAAFVFVTGGPGTGKTLLALELVVRAWLDAPHGSTCLFYSVEQSPENLQSKLASDFEYFGSQTEIHVLDREVPGRLCLEARQGGRTTRLVLTQAIAANLQRDLARGGLVDVDWIQAEIGNYGLTGSVHMVVLDNVGLLLTDLDYFGKRTALLETRRKLIQSRIHGIFVQEETDPRDLRLPSAEEFSTDLLVRLAFRDHGESFKARTVEILKARHQYYYRGTHHFSIAGRGINRDIYLGARNERGPGMHIYPSVPAQLSIARDRSGFRVPRRGDQVLDLGHSQLAACFLNSSGPTAGSSTVILAEPGTRYTYMALRFLAAGRRADEHTIMVSTKEDQDALRRICAREPALRDWCLENGDRFRAGFRVLYLHPEFISSGKFTWDLMRIVEGGHGGESGTPTRRLAFDNIFRLADRFPLISDQRFLIPAWLDLLRYRGVTPLFVDLVPPGAALGRRDFDPSPYMTTFDNVFLLFLDGAGAEQRPHLRVLKSTANDFSQVAVPLNYRQA